MNFQTNKTKGFLNNSLGVLFFVLGLLSCSPKKQSEAESGVKPNIILINIDDLGWTDVGYNGSTFYETPNIDRLAAMGVVFDHAYAGAANCAPSRACLLTGKWTPRHGIYTVMRGDRGPKEHQKIVPAVNTITLDAKFKTIGHYMQDAGYITCHAGKWHMSEDPTNYGFNINIGGGHNGRPESYYPPYGNVNLSDSGDDRYLTDRIMDEVLDFAYTVDSPYFLYYAPYAVHSPFHAVDSLLYKYNTKQGNAYHSNAVYATMIDNLDRNIGRLLNKLDEQSRLDQTLIILTSDNGGVLGISGQSPLRAGKGSYYEGGIREPFIVSWPALMSGGRSNSSIISQIDILPTLLDVVGSQKETVTLDGRSLMPAIANDSLMDDRPLYWFYPIYLPVNRYIQEPYTDPYFFTRPGSAVRLGNWKLLYTFENKKMELYNLAADIGETNNLASEHPEKAQELMTLLEQWWEDTDAQIPTEMILR